MIPELFKQSEDDIQRSGLEIARSRSICESIWAKGQVLDWYTDHSETHSDRILSKLANLIEICPIDPPLTLVECAVLGAAAYYHDIGMQFVEAVNPEVIRETFGPAEYKTVRETHSIESADAVIKEVQSAHLPGAVRLSPVITDDQVGFALSEVCKGHVGLYYGDVVEQFQKSKAFFPRDFKPFRGDLLTALLLLGDELDLHNIRSEYRQDARHSLETRMHHLKHYFIAGADIVLDGAGKAKVQVDFRFPANADWSIYYEWMTVSKLSRQLRLVKPVLQRYGIFLDDKVLINRNDHPLCALLEKKDIAYARYQYAKERLVDLEPLRMMIEDAIRDGITLKVGFSSNYHDDSADIANAHLRHYFESFCESSTFSELNPIWIDLRIGSGAGKDIPDIVSIITGHNLLPRNAEPSAALNALRNYIEDNKGKLAVAITWTDGVPKDIQEFIYTHMADLFTELNTPFFLVDSKINCYGNQYVIPAVSKEDWSEWVAQHELSADNAIRLMIKMRSKDYGICSSVLAMEAVGPDYV